MRSSKIEALIQEVLNFDPVEVQHCPGSIQKKLQSLAIEVCLTNPGQKSLLNLKFNLYYKSWSMPCLADLNEVESEQHQTKKLNSRPLAKNWNLDLNSDHHMKLSINWRETKKLFSQARSRRNIAPHEVPLEVLKALPWKGQHEVPLQLVLSSHDLIQEVLEALPAKRNGKIWSVPKARLSLIISKL